MNWNYSPLLGLLNFILCQAWVVDEIADEARDVGNNFGTMLLGAFVLIVTCGIIYIIKVYYTEKIIAKQRRIEELKENERHNRYLEEIALEKKEKMKFIASLQCPNYIEIDGYRAVDLGLGDAFGTPYWGTENIGSDNIFSNGTIFAWSKIEQAKIQKFEFNKEFTPLQNATVEDFYSIGSDFDYSGHSSFDAATCARSELWFTPCKGLFNQLLTVCIWEFIDKFGILGWKVIGPNENFIFLPCKREETTVYLTSSTTTDEMVDNDSKVATTELGKSKYAYFLKAQDSIMKLTKPKFIEQLRIDVGVIRPVSFGTVTDKIYINDIVELPPVNIRND